jgi:uncharacterized lipoprotein YmbA
MTIRTLLILAIVGCASAGCVLKQSRPSRMFVLDALADRVGTSAPPAEPSVVVEVSKVLVPAWIDRPQVTRRKTETGEVAADDYARWGEPIARGIQRVLVDNLAALLPERRVVAVPFAASGVQGQRLELEVTEATRQMDGSVLLEARWVVLGRGGVPLMRRQSSHRTMPSATGAAGTVHGISRALAILSAEVVAAIRALPAMDPASDDGGTPSGTNGSVAR